MIILDKILGQLTYHNFGTFVEIMICVNMKNYTRVSAGRGMCDLKMGKVKTMMNIL